MKRKSSSVRSSVSPTHPQLTDTIPDSDDLESPGHFADWLLRQEIHDIETQQGALGSNQPRSPPESVFSEDGGVALPPEAFDGPSGSREARLRESSNASLQSLPSSPMSRADDSEASTIIETDVNSGQSVASGETTSGYPTTGYYTSIDDSSDFGSGTSSDDYSWVTVEESFGSGSWASGEDRNWGAYEEYLASGGEDRNWGAYQEYLRHAHIASRERSPPPSLSQLPSLTSGETAPSPVSTLSVANSSGPSVIDYLPRFPWDDENEESWYVDSPSVADSEDSVS